MLRVDRALTPSFDLLDDGSLVWELTGGELGIDQFIPHADFEAAPLGRFKCEAGDLLFEVRKHGGRQTDGARFIVSRGAILQLNLHRQIS